VATTTKRKPFKRAPLSPLALARERLGLTADRFSIILGVDPVTLWRWEKHQRIEERAPQLSYAIAIAIARNTGRASADQLQAARAAVLHELRPIKQGGRGPLYALAALLQILLLSEPQEATGAPEMAPRLLSRHDLKKGQ